MTYKIHYSIHNLVEVIVDSGVSDEIIKNINFQIGYFKTSSPNPSCSSRIMVKPYEDFSPAPALTWHTFHLWRGIIGKNLDDTAGRLAFEKGGYGYTVYADSSSFLINLFIQLLLIEHGISLVHAAAVADTQGRVTLLPGAGGVGKTALLGEMVKNHNYRVLGDDIVGLSEQGDCLSFPRSFILKEYHRSIFPEVFQRLNSETQSKAGISMRAVATNLKNITRENAPFIGLIRITLQRLGLFDKVAQQFSIPGPLPYLAAVPVEEIFGAGSVVERGSLERIVFLERYAGNEFRLEPISEEALCRRVFAILHHEWVGIMEQFLAMGALEMLDLPSYFERVTAVIRSGISRKNCKMLLIPDNASPKELADYFFLSVSQKDA